MVMYVMFLISGSGLKLLPSPLNFVCGGMDSMNFWNFVEE